MGKLRLQETVLTVRNGLRRPTRLSLDALRLVTMIIPDTFSWRVVQASGQKGFYNLDLLNDGLFRGLIRELAELVAMAKARHLRGLKFCLSDYDGRWAAFSLGDVKRSRVPFLEALGLSRARRLENLRAWLDARPRVVLRSGFGARAVLDREGYRNGKDGFIAWQDFERIRPGASGPGNAVVAFAGRRSSAGFGFEHRRPPVLKFPAKKRQLFVAECAFWQSLPPLRKPPMSRPQPDKMDAHDTSKM